MNKSLAWKLALIAAVILGSLAVSYPPEKKVALGLDLRGGAHILMQVRTEATLKYEMDAAVNRIGQALTERKLAYDAVVATDDTTLEIRGTDPARAAEVRQVIDMWLGQWNLAPIAGGAWRATMPPERRAQLQAEAIDTTLATLDRRIDGLGVAEAVVQKQGTAGDRILILLPGVEDPERVKQLIGATELLEWKAVTYPPSAGPNPCGSGWRPPTDREELLRQFPGGLPADTELFAEELAQPDGTTLSIWWPLKRVSVVRGTDLVNASASFDEWNSPQIDFELSQDAGRRFEETTKANVGCVLAIVLGTSERKRVISAPVVQGPIRDRGRIMGQYTPQSAQDFALQLRSGAIPTDLKIIEERTVGPSLGRDSIRSGLTAGIAGIAGIAAFMVLYYRASGINAVLALLLNVLIVFGLMGIFPYLFSGAKITLTLPGIAGLILTVGMAVDTNVLIFERIREELRLGKTVRSAIEQGFSRAFGTIIDVHITTLISAFFLFSYGTGPVKGFAVTLTLGLLVSLFTAVFVSRQMFELVIALRGGRLETLSI